MLLAKNKVEAAKHASATLQAHAGHGIKQNKQHGSGPTSIVDDFGNLPEPPSEYSDSDEDVDSDDDDDELVKGGGSETPDTRKLSKRRKGKPIAGWAQTPFVREALISQQQRDPEDIFGTVKPCKLDEIFAAKNSGPVDIAGAVQKHKRLVRRGSTQHWTGGDALTYEEEVAYKRKMGYIAAESDENDK
eukprot:jgi/Hompol1/2549/HPOL_004917-RA